MWAALLYSTPAIGQSCGCDVSDLKEKRYDALLLLREAEKEASEAVHLPWGIPASPPAATNEHLLHQRYYITMYDDDLWMPLWVAYRLTKEDVNVHRSRTECFRRDPRLDEEDAAFCSDYDEPVYDRGHMVPNADMKRSEAAMINTYMFSNMAPQHDKFNRNVWAYLEDYVRDWANVKGEIYVVTGAVFDRDGNGKRDKDSDADRMASRNDKVRVAVPTHFYKILFHERPSSFIETMTFLLPHEDSSPSKKDTKEYLRQHLSSIDEIEKLTGVDFLAVIKAEDKAKEKAIEGFTATRLWPTEG